MTEIESKISGLIEKRDQIEVSIIDLMEVEDLIEHPEFRARINTLPDLTTEDPLEFLANYSRILEIKEKAINLAPKLNEIHAKTTAGLIYWKARQREQDLADFLEANRLDAINPSEFDIDPEKEEVSVEDDEHDRYLIGLQPAEQQLQEEVGPQRTLILIDEVVKELPKQQKEIAVTVNNFILDPLNVNLTNEEREQYLIEQVYGQYLDEGSMTYKEAIAEFLRNREELNNYLKPIEITLNNDNLFEGDADSGFLIDTNNLSETSEPNVVPAKLEEQTETGPSSREIARKARLEATRPVVKEIIEKLVVPKAGFYSKMGMQIFRNRAKPCFGKNFDDKTLNLAIKNKVIRPEVKLSTGEPLLTFEEQATLVYIVLHGMKFLGQDGKDFIMDISIELFKEWQEEQKKKEAEKK